MLTSLPSAKALMTHADDRRHIVYATWIVPKFFPYMRDLLCVLYLNDVSLRVVVSSDTVTQRRTHKTAREGGSRARIQQRPRPAEQHRLSMPENHRRATHRLQTLWQRNGNVGRRKQRVAGGHRRDDLLHPRDRLSLRGADVQPDEGEPSGTTSHTRVLGPQAASSFPAVIRDRVRHDCWSLLRMFGMVRLHDSSHLILGLYNCIFFFGSIISTYVSSRISYYTSS